MTLAQILFGFYFAFLGAYLSVVLTRVLRQNGTAINELKELIKTESQGIKSLIKGK